MHDTLIGILIGLQLDWMADGSDDPRVEQLVDGYRAHLDTGHDLAELAKDLCIDVTAVDVVRDIVATTVTPHGGTRVIEVSAEICRFGFERITVVAYDSAHRGDAHLLSTSAYSAADLDRARATAAAYFTPADGCTCLPGWDPRCGTKGCTGIYVHKPLALAGAR